MYKEKEMTFDQWWQYYRGLKSLTHDIPGIRMKAEKAWNKLGLDKNTEEAQRIFDCTNALARFDLDRLNRGEKIDRWPHGSTFLNQGYFDREIESHVEARAREKRFCKCGAETHGNSDKCAYHYSMEGNLVSELRQKFKELGLKQQEGESKAQYIDRMRDIYRQLIKQFSNSL